MSLNACRRQALEVAGQATVQVDTLYRALQVRGRRSIFCSAEPSAGTDFGGAAACVAAVLHTLVILFLLAARSPPERDCTGTVTQPR